MNGIAKQGSRSKMYMDAIKDPFVLLSAFFIVFNPILWNAIGRYEYRTKRISGAVGQHNGVYMVAGLIFFLGLLRDMLFALAMKRTSVNQLMQRSLLLTVFGRAMSLGGLCLVLTSLYRLGIVGTYLGDYFGILFPKKITAFPFSNFEHPMYQGATMLFLGTALTHGSPVGLMLGTLAGAVYSIAGSIEAPFTAMIYSQAASDNTRIKNIINGLHKGNKNGYRRIKRAGKTD